MNSFAVSAEPITDAFDFSEAIPIASVSIRDCGISLLDADFFECVEEFFSDDDKKDMGSYGVTQECVASAVPIVTMSVFTVSEDACLASVIPAVCFAVPAKCSVYTDDDSDAKLAKDDEIVHTRAEESKECNEKMETLGNTSSCYENTKQNRSRAIARWLEKKSRIKKLPLPLIRNARKEASAKRFREKGRFKKSSTTWLSMADFAATHNSTVC